MGPRRTDLLFAFDMMNVPYPFRTPELNRPGFSGDLVS